GHNAGDRLLINACDCLRVALGEEGLFRAGGDEFLAICLQIQEQALWEKIELLKQKLQEASVQMAVGAIWEKESQKDMDRLIAEAEKNMYREKAEYYRRTGIERRKQ
ncbi:MAG: diguanylate cyclase, partial [Lachnospiraceae bacterium]|nr:diguanylate cyclase [Lachnospiraceae bacterium]